MLMLSMSSKQAHDIMQRAGFLNTYMLSKNLTEKMVMLCDGQPAPICIVRPSLVGAVAGMPCPVSLQVQAYMFYRGDTPGYTSMHGL